MPGEMAGGCGAGGAAKPGAGLRVAARRRAAPNSAGRIMSRPFLLARDWGRERSHRQSLVTAKVTVNKVQQNMSMSYGRLVAGWSGMRQAVIWNMFVSVSFPRKSLTEKFDGV
ncbi:hypothetical protein Aph02nite_27180 [Actinoplanes philippinensis]|nr:hypothetical protein Aph02nite_27180 [Actinoplanes philippinensis]